MVAALAFCASALTGPAASQNWDVNQTSVNALSRAYGYCRGQALTTARIAETYPGLAPATLRAEMLFRTGTGNICDELEGLLRTIFGENGFSTLKAEMAAELAGTVGQQQITEEMAIRFIGEVEARAGWAIERPVLETMLGVRYRDDPAGEMRDGHVQDFDTSGHPKAGGLVVRLAMPRSWRGDEGKRPHIVQLWTSQNGGGQSTMHLDIRTTEGYTPTHGEVEAEVAAGLEDWLPGGGVLRDGGSFELENQPGVWMVYDITESRIDLTFAMRAAYYMMFFDGHAISLMCQTALPEDAATANPDVLDARFERLLPLCRTALNSLVLPQAYLR